ncbi:MAG: hypothetical protein C0497_10410 [Gemmatimonas sp.]|nr:hypothetical protein [Gemmatimonas sp.]
MPRPSQFHRRGRAPRRADLASAATDTHPLTEGPMADSPSRGVPESPPFMQRMFDNVFLLLVLGIVIMLVVYTGWGMWEILTMPVGTLP